MKKLFSLLLIAIPLFSCETNNQQTQTVDLGDQQPDSIKDTIIHSSTTVNNNATKIKEEVYVEAAEVVGSAVWQELKEKRKRDSTELANRGKILVYQIGVPKNDKDELYNSYSKLVGLPDIYAFKADDNYYLIKTVNYTEQTMQDSLSAMSAQLARRGVTDPIVILNALAFCKRKETIVHGKKVKIRHHDDVPCYVCD
jgi:hypothetical protein